MCKKAEFYGFTIGGHFLLLHIRCLNRVGLVTSVQFTGKFVC